MSSGLSALRKHPWYTTGAAIVAFIAGITGILVTGDDGDSSTSSTASTATASSDSGLANCDASTLPDEAFEVMNDIANNGPFEYPANDGTHFGNYEGILPDADSQYYREYTVDTPGLNHRGARRIITGGADADDPDTWYYTDDHYKSFCTIPESALLDSVDSK
ncbi:MAG: ribonuclease domain-containing protein [Corynebacterium sp.]|nr:ribonuclease domain-containing protein [Corynebacterium sp.]